MFPSPTGATYYESAHAVRQRRFGARFRPQQGLPIMNKELKVEGFFK